MTRRRITERGQHRNNILHFASAFSTLNRRTQRQIEDLTAARGVRGDGKLQANASDVALALRTLRPSATKIGGEALQIIDALEAAESLLKEQRTSHIHNPRPRGRGRPSPSERRRIRENTRARRLRRLQEADSGRYIENPLVSFALFVSDELSSKHREALKGIFQVADQSGIDGSEFEDAVNSYDPDILIELIDEVNAVQGFGDDTNYADLKEVLDAANAALSSVRERVRRRRRPIR